MSGMERLKKWSPFSLKPEQAEKVTTAAFYKDKIVQKRTLINLHIHREEG